MALTFEHWRAGEVLPAQPSSGASMEYWRDGEVLASFEVAASAADRVPPFLLVQDSASRRGEI